MGIDWLSIGRASRYHYGVGSLGLALLKMLRNVVGLRPPRAPTAHPLLSSRRAFTRQCGRARRWHSVRRVPRPAVPVAAPNGNARGGVTVSRDSEPLRNRCVLLFAVVLEGSKRAPRRSPVRSAKTENKVHEYTRQRGTTMNKHTEIDLRSGGPPSFSLAFV